MAAYWKVERASPPISPKDSRFLDDGATLDRTRKPRPRRSSSPLLRLRRGGGAAYTVYTYVNPDGSCRNIAGISKRPGLDLMNHLSGLPIKRFTALTLPKAPQVIKGSAGGYGPPWKRSGGPCRLRASFAVTKRQLGIAGGDRPGLRPALNGEAATSRLDPLR